MVGEAKLETVRPKILDGVSWEELKRCGIPAHQLYVAINRELPTIPIELAKQYARKINSTPHNVLLLMGDTGTGKTVLGIRYMVKLIADGYSPPIYIPSYILSAILRGEMKIVRTYHPLLGYATEFTATYNRKDGEVIALEELGHRYGVIMIDDLRGEEVKVFNTLVEQVYQSGAKLIVTTNLKPTEFKKYVEDRASSRLEDIGYALQLEGQDLRRCKR